MTDAGLATLSQLSELRELDLNETGVTDEGMKWVGQLSHLQYLGLPTKITGQGASALEPLTELIGVGCSGYVSAECVEWLSRRPVLESLSLDRCTFADDVHFCSQGFRELEFLTLAKSNVTIAMLEELTELQSLAEMDLGYTQVTDAAMRGIGSLPALSVLFINDTAITDAGIRSMGASADVMVLSLVDTAVTDASVDVLLSFDKLVLGSFCVDDGPPYTIADAYAFSARPMDSIQSTFGTTVVSKSLKNLPALSSNVRCANCIVAALNFLIASGCPCAMRFRISQN